MNFAVVAFFSVSIQRWNHENLIQIDSTLILKGAREIDRRPPTPHKIEIYSFDFGHVKALNFDFRWVTKGFAFLRAKRLTIEWIG